MRINALLIVFIAALTAPVAAQEACETLQKVTFNAGTITPVRAKRGFVTQIVLGAGETIIDKRGGDTDGWEVSSVQGQPILTVKPRSNANPSNLIITTDRRAYVMSLYVLPDNSRCNGTWQIIYSIPQPPAIAIVRETPEQIAAKRKATLKEALKSVPENKNWSYSMEALTGSDDIVPNEIYDDGRFTFMRFSGNRELPSIFRVTPDNEEVIVDRHMEGRDLVVIHEVARRWVLRLDKQTIGIWNDNFDLDGIPPVAGTVSDKVQRITNGLEYGDE